MDKKIISSPASRGSGVGISPDFRDKLGFRSSDVVFSLKLVVYFLLIVFGLVAINQGALLIKVVGTIILGVVFAHGVELQHQVLHNQGYRNRKINDFIGFILGLPMLVSYSHYKFKHLNHHRYLGTDKNEEFFDYGNQYGQHGVSALASWVLRLFMLPHYVVLVKNISSSLLGEKKFKKITGLEKDIWSDYRNMAFLISLAIFLGFYFDSIYLIFIWIVPFIFIAVPVHSLIEMPEHFLCNTKSNNVFENTRTIRSNSFMYWLTNGNNYHVEHHLYPNLPIDRLHELHDFIEKECAYISESYFQYYRGIILSIMRKGLHE